MPGDVMMQILKRLRDLEDEVKRLQTRQRNVDYLVLRDGVTAPTAVPGLAIQYVDIADGDLKVVFGDGTRKTITVDT